MIGDFVKKACDDAEAERVHRMIENPDRFKCKRNWEKFKYIAFPASVFHLKALSKYLNSYHGTDSETTALNKLYGAVRKKIVEAQYPVGNFDKDIRLLFG